MSLNKYSYSSSVLRESRSSWLEPRRKKDYTSVQIRPHTRIHVFENYQTINQNSKPTLQQVRRSKSLANIRLMAATKMRVKPSRPVFKPHLFHPFVRFCPDVCVVKHTCNQHQHQTLLINTRPSISNHSDLLQMRGALEPRASLNEDFLKREIEEEIRKRHQINKYEEMYLPPKRVQSGKNSKGLILGRPAPPRSASVRHIRPDNQAIAPWERTDQPQMF